LSETFLILRRTEPDVATNVNWPSFNYSSFLSDFNKPIKIYSHFRKVPKYHI